MTDETRKPIFAPLAITDEWIRAHPDLVGARRHFPPGTTIERALAIPPLPPHPDAIPAGDLIPAARSMRSRAETGSCTPGWYYQYSQLWCDPMYCRYGVPPPCQIAVKASDWQTFYWIDENCNVTDQTAVFAGCSSSDCGCMA